jgi:hypothetical protein
MPRSTYSKPNIHQNSPEILELSALERSFCPHFIFRKKVLRLHKVEGLVTPVWGTWQLFVFGSVVTVSRSTAHPPRFFEVEPRLISLHTVTAAITNEKQFIHPDLFDITPGDITFLEYSEKTNTVKTLSEDMWLNCNILEAGRW